MFEGNGDNEGTTQERTAKCSAACFNKNTALANGPWSARGDAVGYAMTSNGRCYCQHEKFESCTKAHTVYIAYEFTESGVHPTTSGGDHIYVLYMCTLTLCLICLQSDIRDECDRGGCSVRIGLE